MHVAGANTVLPIVDAAKYIKHTLCGFEARIINRGSIRNNLSRRHNGLNCALHFSLMSSVDSQRCGLRVIAAGMSKGNDPTSTAISECSESANEDILLFFFQLDLTTRIQCALNTDQYEIAQQLRSKLAEVEQEVARQRESKMGSTSSKDEAQDKAIAILRLRTDLQKAIEDEDYVYAAELRNKISKLEAESLAAAAKALAYQNVEYAFRLGQKVRHAVFGYRAVICGMDPLCCESSSWIENANVDKLSRGRNQPFYQNLLLSTNDRNAVLKIADFGFARSLQPQGLAETLCGSPLYMAPEIMQSRKYDAKADLWSVGTILFQLVTGNPPFSGNSQFQLMQNIMRSNELHFPHDIVGDLHPDCIDLCQKLLRRDPVERLSFEEFFNHRFMIEQRPVGGYGNTSMGSGDSTVVETADASQDDCLPLTLDEDRHSFSSSLLGTKNTSSSSSSYNHLDANMLTKRTLSNKSFPTSKEAPSDSLDIGTNLQFSTSKYKLQMSFESAPQKVSIVEGEQAANVEQELTDTISSKGVLDSLECIEQEYVLVNVHAASTETLSSFLGASGLDHSQSKSVVSPSRKIQKSINAPTQIVGATEGSISGVESLESQSSIPLGTSEASISSRDMLERPSDHPPTRLDVLQRCAHLITELAKEKLEAGQQLEAFAILLVCLAIWKQALRVSHTWAASFQESSPCEGLVHSQDMHEEGDSQEAAAACSQMEQKFSSAVDNAVQLASHLGPLDADAEMPDAMEILFQTALAFGKKGAMEELFGAMDNAAALYLKSTTLLSFILVEASSLELNPPFSPSISDRQRLRRYIDCLTHQNQSIARSRVFV